MRRRRRVNWQLEEVTDLQALEDRADLGKRAKRTASMDHDPFDLAAEDIDPTCVFIIYTHPVIVEREGAWLAGRDSASVEALLLTHIFRTA